MMFINRILGPRGKNSLRKRIETHLGRQIMESATMSHSIRAVERVNIQITLDRWLERERGAAVVGFTSSMYQPVGLADLAAGQDLHVAPIEREAIAVAPGKEQDFPVRGVYLLDVDQQPVAVMIRQGRPPFEGMSLDVLAGDRATAKRVHDRLLDESQRDNVYRGRTIMLTSGDNCYPREININFGEMPPATRESLVLPDDVMTVMERNVLGLLRHREVLARAGRSTRHGLLFHGPPGTGKTLAVRYLASAAEGHTVIILTGRQLGLIRESCQIAKLLAPSIVILEDVDLVAMDRAENEHAALLHELMDEMDGLGTKAAVIFLLTTNRPEKIEPALSGRPGRIDQAIAFPLPDADCRRRLFSFFSHGLDLSAVDLDRWIDQTDGVSPAFIEELLRKSALMAAEKGQTESPLKLTDEDISAAVKELVFFGGPVTQRLLGYKVSGNGDVT